MSGNQRFSTVGRSQWGLIALVFLGACASHQDIYIHNARIWTNDPSNPIANSMHICDSVIVAIGDGVRQRCNKAGHGPFSGTAVSIVDGGGATVIPGLIDAHLHLISGGQQLSRLNLRDVSDREAFVAEVAERAKQTPKGQWITGGRWSTESWSDPAQPTKEWIDESTSDHPVLLSRMDGHGALANSVALRAAGIGLYGPPDPPGGVIDRHPITGEPTGILKESAIGLVSRHIPPPTDEELEKALLAAQVEAHRHGITGVHTMSPYRELVVIDRAHTAGKLTLRVRLYISENDWGEYLDRAKAHRGDEMVRVCGFKQFADGSLGSRTAYMVEPFKDNPKERHTNRGVLREVFEEEGHLETMIDAAYAAKLGSAIHAIGDLANHMVLDIYDKILAQHGKTTSEHHGSSTSTPQSAIRDSQFPRLRIEHAQHLLPGDISRFARLGVIASMQPLHKADDARYAEKAIGTERCKTSYAFRSLLDAGAPLAFGSDWPVVSINPFFGVHAAVTARTLDGGIFMPEQSIRVEEALQAYTNGAAWAAGDESRLGRLAPGYLADFVILDRDLFAIEPDELKNVGVKATYVGGRCVWSAVK